MKEILAKLASGNASAEEKEKFGKWIDTLSEKEYENVLLEWESLMAATNTDTKADEELLKAIHNRILADQNEGRAVVRSMQNRRWLWAAASVIIVIGIGLGVYRLLNTHPASQPQKTVAIADIKAPDANRAKITLADGRSVYLDSLNNGQVAMQGDVRVVKLENGKVAYESGSGEGSKTVAYNTLTNPRGSKVINIQLADGTHVWLNAESSVTYPVAFTGNERKVTMTGEAYFEVAHNAAKPFYVAAGGMEVKVLGTHFNVNAYADEGLVKTTLLEGSVDVNTQQDHIQLKPGQQSEVENGFIKLKNDVNIDEVMAWKNGYFSFNDANLKDIMKQIERWYDVEVHYEGTIKPRVFGGGIARSAQLSDVLRILAESEVHFQMEGRKIIVRP